MSQFGKTQENNDNQDYLEYVPDDRDQPEFHDSRVAKLIKNQKLAGITGHKDFIEETKMGGAAE